MNCGAEKVELHAHHLKPYKHFPEFRYSVENGVALCFRCHWDTYTAPNAIAVNSVDILPGQAEDNTEPSGDRKISEGVTTNGRAFRRIILACFKCGRPVSRTVGEFRKNKSGIVFCTKVCMGKNNSKYFRHGSKSDTSAAAERRDIV